MSGDLNPITLGDEPVGPYDADRVERAVREILIGIGENPDRDGLRDTPARYCLKVHLKWPKKKDIFNIFTP